MKIIITQANLIEIQEENLPIPIWIFNIEFSGRILKLYAIMHYNEKGEILDSKFWFEFNILPITISKDIKVIYESMMNRGLELNKYGKIIYSMINKGIIITDQEIITQKAPSNGHTLALGISNDNIDFQMVL